MVGVVVVAVVVGAVVVEVTVVEGCGVVKVVISVKDT